MKRWLIALAALGIVAAGLVYVRSRPLDVSTGEIWSLTIDPYPEGPPGPTFTREVGPDESSFVLGLDRVERYIPDPLPNTAWQGIDCGMGGNLIVTLRDGETITYGPCRRPESINDLWAHMLDIVSDGGCRPRCGPGGLPSP